MKNESQEAKLPKDFLRVEIVANLSKIIKKITEARFFHMWELSIILLLRLKIMLHEILFYAFGVFALTTGFFVVVEKKMFVFLNIYK